MINVKKLDDKCGINFQNRKTKIEEYSKKSFDGLQYNLSNLNSKIFTLEKNVDELYKAYTRINTTKIREIYNQIDLNFKKVEKKQKTCQVKF